MLGHLLYMSTASVEALLRLPKSKRLELAERLWLSVADEESLLVPAAHKRILDERLQSCRAGKSEPIPHKEMMQRLRKS